MKNLTPHKRGAQGVPATPQNEQATTEPQFTTGQEVVWLFTPPYGYGFQTPVKAYYVKRTSKRIVIDAVLKDGSTKRFQCP